jgi:hypothetical protein
MYKFYDTDICSEVEKPNFLSDDEPPSDKIKDKKIIYKEELLKVTKEIWRVKEKKKKIFLIQ